MCASLVKGLTAGILRYIRFLITSLSHSSDVSQKLMLIHTHKGRSLSRNSRTGGTLVYGRHPSNPEDDQEGAYRALVGSRIEENEMAVASLDRGGKVGSTGKVD
ncbi:hypothetical protein AZE42_10432 [Rhizopogon vesiculosus]|uniref:Uncharacterized protein n=1 Tax=Rhizopogon vesiculosus TaxID=180088 RepID=A0A1J8PM93_9AGAM|nr:hypothetical protein AZE42_10432 [Rhizopogon vesiculosus]